ncbi:MAG TPA: efflux RND transporter periplasmic adaptor subunit [Phycisphaerales bacterium]|nr:efflux RND transporter periplasmic adaptor subunit [Phycisphaerales bacterium]
MIMRTRTILISIILVLAALPACRRSEPGKPPAQPGHAHEENQASAPTNRVDIPPLVRQNLGITFARVEKRNVARTMRIPGSFELLPTAHREYRAPLAGRVELLITQYQHVERGTPLYRLASPAWRDLLEEIISAQATVDSMTPLREAHRVHETSLTDKVTLWKDRLKQLEELRAAGGGSASLFTEARATLNATQAELADVMEKDAELEAQQQRAESQLRALKARQEQMLVAAGGTPADASAHELVIRALTPGVIDQIALPSGGLAEENSLILSAVQPDQIRFRAQALQSDLARLTPDLPARIVPPSGAGHDAGVGIPATISLAPLARAEQRTIDVLAHPQDIAQWARPGLLAQLEITLSGGREELAIPQAAIVKDGAIPIIFRRDPSSADRVIRLTADVGVSDGLWTVIASGVKAGDEVVVDGSYQLMLATSGSAAKGGHFHADGTFHEGEE